MGFVYIEGGRFDITAANDGIQAETTLTVTDGTFDIVSGGGHEKSTKTHTDNFGGGMFGGHGGRQFGEENADGFGGMPFGNEDFTNSGDSNNTAPTQLANITADENTSTDESTYDSTQGLKAAIPTER